MEKQREIIVALIDGGLNSNEFEVKESVGLTMKNDMIQIISNPKNKSNHGINVARCIKSIYPNVEFIDINILDENMESNSKVLLKALEYCKDLNVDIINISLGTTNRKYYFKMKRILKQIIKNEVIIVAADSNDGEISYPANIKEVVKVKGYGGMDSSKTFYNEGYYYSSNVLSKDLISRKSEEGICGNSIACGFITGHVCKTLNKFSFSTVKDMLNRGDLI